MKLILSILIPIVVTFSCTDSQSEKLIEGQWHAVKIMEDIDNKEHILPDGIHLNFHYPKYNFEGEQEEAGNYYIKDEQLHLMPDDQESQRNIPILKLTPDTLTLQLVDSLGTRSVHFIRNNN